MVRVEGVRPGWEGAVCFNDSIREYQVSIRAVGDTWWKVIGHAGHAHILESERMQRARDVIERWLQANGK